MLFITQIWNSKKKVEDLEMSPQSMSHSFTNKFSFQPELFNKLPRTFSTLWSAPFSGYLTFHSMKDSTPYFTLLIWPWLMNTFHSTMFLLSMWQILTNKLFLRMVWPFSSPRTSSIGSLVPFSGLLSCHLMWGCTACFYQCIHVDWIIWETLMRMKWMNVMAFLLCKLWQPVFVGWQILVK